MSISITTQDFEVPAVFETSTNLVMLMHFMDMQNAKDYFSLLYEMRERGEKKTVIQFGIDDVICSCSYAL